MRRGDEKGVLELAVKRGVEKGIEKAVEKAVENEKGETLTKKIFNLHKNGVDLNTIALSLGITIEEVKSCLSSTI